MTTGKFCNIVDPYSDPRDSPKNLNYDSNSDYIFDTNMKSEQEEEYPPIDEWQRKWDSGTISWAVVNTSDDLIIQDWEERAVAIALRTWGLRITNVKFRKQSIYANPLDADIVIKWDSPNTNDYFKTKPNVLAYAYFPGQGKVSGDVTFNDSYIWSRDGLPINAHEIDPDNYGPDTKVEFKTYNVIQTLIHELGHSLGLRHNTVCHDCIMYPYYNGYVTLHDNDVNRIQSFYGKRTLSAWIIEYFRKRLIRKFNGKRTVGGIK